MQSDIDCPTLPGAYVLVVDLPEPLAFRIAGRAIRLAPGRYAYCGSAWGPGGLAARVTRHLRPGKRVHWHVDHLTRAGQIAAVGIGVHDRECALFGAIARLPDARIPAPGFGSTDCSRCKAHLAAVGPQFMPGAIGLRDVLAA